MKNKTTTINPELVSLAGTPQEICDSLILFKKEALGQSAWVSDIEIGFINGIIKSLVILRGMNLVIEPKELEKINTLSDFDNIQKRELSFTVILDYLNLQATIDLYYMMNRLLDDKGFRKKPNLKELRYNIKNLEIFLEAIGFKIEEKTIVNIEIIEERIEFLNKIIVKKWEDLLKK